MQHHLAPFNGTLWLSIDHQMIAGRVVIKLISYSISESRSILSFLFLLLGRLGTGEEVRCLSVHRCRRQPISDNETDSHHFPFQIYMERYESPCRVARSSVTIFNWFKRRMDAGEPIKKVSKEKQKSLQQKR
jgi:hypothetical protein